MNEFKVSKLGLSHSKCLIAVRNDFYREAKYKGSEGV
jgi:hypothetical protein